MLTCVLRTQITKFKIELENKFYIEKINFENFNTLNVQFSKKIYICFLNLCPKDIS